MGNPDLERQAYPLIPGLRRPYWPDILAPARAKAFTALALRRMIATGIDFFLLELISLAGLYALFAFEFPQSLFPGGDTLFYALYSALSPAIPCLPLLVLIGIESGYGASPGKLVMGLRLELAEHGILRLMQLGARNALKWIPLFACLLCSPFARFLDWWNLPQSWLQWETWQSMTLPGIWGLLCLAFLLVRPERLLHDWLTGTCVEAIKPRAWPAMVSLCLGSGIATILSFMAISAFTSLYRGEDRALISSVKANMHTFQTMVETYALDWKGEYPQNTQAVNQDARRGKYWKDFINPFTSWSGPYYSYADIWAFRGLNKDHAGLVLYDPIISHQGRVSHYYLYGLDQEGRRIRYKGQDFVLTNH